MLEITGLPACLWGCLSTTEGGRDGTEEMEQGQSLSTLAFKELKVPMKWEVGSP